MSKSNMSKSGEPGKIEPFRGLVSLCVLYCTCKQCRESPVPWPSLQRRKQPLVQEMNPPSEGGRKAENKQMSVSILGQHFKLHLHGKYCM